MLADAKYWTIRDVNKLVKKLTSSTTNSDIPQKHFSHLTLNDPSCQSQQWPSPTHCYLFIFGRRSFLALNVINATLLHQRIIKCQVMPWRRTAVAGSQWRGEGGGVCEEPPGGRACWEGLMAHLTPACPPLSEAGPLTLSPPWRWGRPAVAKWACSLKRDKDRLRTVSVWFPDIPSQPDGDVLPTVTSEGAASPPG